jgi:hypothetical protein
VLICLLACYLIWHLRQAWAPLTFTDEHPPTRDNRWRLTSGVNGSGRRLLVGDVTRPLCRSFSWPSW